MICNVDSRAIRSNRRGVLRPSALCVCALKCPFPHSMWPNQCNLELCAKCSFLLQGGDVRVFLEGRAKPLFDFLGLQGVECRGYRFSEGAPCPMVRRSKACVRKNRYAYMLACEMILWLMSSSGTATTLSMLFMYTFLRLQQGLLYCHYIYLYVGYLIRVYASRRRSRLHFML